jgi:hypothetical protein
MNLFAVHRDPRTAARSLCDRHVVKMTLETAQILCTAARLHGHDAPYRATHRHHPCVLWTAARRANWDWVVRHGLALAAEYERRFGRVHSSRAVIEWARDHAVAPPPGGRRQPFPQAMPAAYRGPDPVAAYRRFYLAEKARFAAWTPPAVPPPWWPRAAGAGSAMLAAAR